MKKNANPATPYHAFIKINYQGRDACLTMQFRRADVAAQPAQNVT